MENKIAFVTYFLALLILPSCFQEKSNVSVANNNLGNKIVQDGEATELGIDSGELAGTNIELPAGSLAIGSTVAIDEAEVPDAFKNHNGVTPASPALSVTATDKDGNLINSLDTAMTLKIPFSAEATLALIDVEKTEENLCVFLDGDDDLFYVWRRAAFTVTANIVILQSNRFGVYQLYFCGSENIDESQDAASSGVAGSFSSSTDGGTSDNNTTTTVDTTPPSKPTLMNDGDRNESSTSSPTISWGAVTASDLSHYEIALGSTAGASDILAWTAVGNVVTKQLTGLTLPNGTNIYASVVAVDSSGNKSVKSNGDGWQQLVCPDHYVKVEGNTTAGLGGSVYSAGTKVIYDWATPAIFKTRSISDFCIMKYEARDDSTNVSPDPSFGLYTGITRANAEAQCSSISADHYLVQNNFWQAVAREVASVDLNWTQADHEDTSSSNFLFSGHNDNDPSSQCSDVIENMVATSCTNNGGLSQDNRKLQLRSGDTIWDLSGNVEEWIRDNNAIGLADTTEIKSLIGANALKFGDDFDHSNRSHMSGLGKFTGTTTNTYFVRGGQYADTISAGVFMIRSMLSDSTAAERGFRCIFAP